MSPLDRKRASEAFLKSKHIAVDPTLPLIEADFPARSVEEIARRAMCLTLVALKAEGMGAPQVNEFAREHSLGPKTLTPSEQRFLAAPPADEDAEWVWRFEALHVLLWALGYVVDLGWPIEESNAPEEVEFLRELGPQGFIEGALPRSNDQLLDAADWVYRLHQAVVDERGGTEGIIEEQIEEWSHALDWLTREEEAWDSSEE